MTLGVVTTRASGSGDSIGIGILYLSTAQPALCL